MVQATDDAARRTVGDDDGRHLRLLGVMVLEPLRDEREIARLPGRSVAARTTYKLTQPL